MSKFKELIHTLFNNLHDFISHHKVTVSDIGFAMQMVSIVSKVKTETAGISDGVALTNAIVKSVIKHAHELPEELKGDHLDETIVQICQKILDLPIEEIQSIVKGELGK